MSPTWNLYDVIGLVTRPGHPTGACWYAWCEATPWHYRAAMALTDDPQVQAELEACAIEAERAASATGVAS